MSSQYVPRNILLTGAAGFIGSHVAVRLAANYSDYNLVVLDRLDHCASLKNIESIESSQSSQSKFTFVNGNIQDIALVSRILREHEIDTVMHFAAQTHVDNSFGNSLSFTMDNTFGTHVLLEACRQQNGAIERIINVSTDEVYGESSVGKREGLPELSILEPTNPYSAAKAGAEMLCKAYMTSYGLPIIITRGNNVYGPNQFPEKLIPKFIILASRGQDLPVHGSGTAVRSYLYVDDVAEAFDCILHKGSIGEVYNIGTSEERTVAQVARDIAQHFSLPESKICHVRDRAFNDQRYYIGGDKLAALGWRQRTSWKEGLLKTIGWYVSDFSTYWIGDVESALHPHPTVSM